MYHFNLPRLVLAGLAVASSFTTAHRADIEPRQTVSTNPWCFNTCYGVNNTVITQAINLFCTQYAGVTINTNGIAGTFIGIYTDIPYAPMPGTTEQGKIYLEILAQPVQSCGTQVVDYNTCLYNFWEPINQCNQDSADGKQGGIVYDPCLMFYITPNPDGC